MVLMNFYTKYDSYIFKQNEILMDKAIDMGFAVIELSKLQMYESYNDELQPYIGEKKQLHYMHTDNFVLSSITKLYL